MEDNAILEMLIEQKELIKSLDKKIATQQTPTQQNISQQVDIEKVEYLTDQIQTSITKIDDVIKQIHQPIIKQHKFTVDIISRGTVFIFIGMLVIISALSAGLYIAQQPNYDRIDNDLKYRYIKMKGSATPARIIELEDLFESNRDNTKIRQMHEDVEQYENTVYKRAIAIEQARLKQQESSRLNKKATELKEK